MAAMKAMKKAMKKAAPAEAPAMRKKAMKAVVRCSNVAPAVKAMTSILETVVERDSRMVQIRRTFKYRPYRGFAKVAESTELKPKNVLRLEEGHVSVRSRAFMRSFACGPRRRWRHGRLIPADDTTPLSLTLMKDI